jgi:putative aldouronate transport system substrate-binding protein
MKRKVAILLLALMVFVSLPFAVMQAEEPYTYTMVMYNFGPLDEDPLMVKHWNDKYGVVFKPINVEQSSAQEQINLMISAGEVPDIMQSIDANAYFQQGIIGGWTEEFFREHAPRLAKYIDETEPKSWAYAKYDGTNM